MENLSYIPNVFFNGFWRQSKSTISITCLRMKIKVLLCCKISAKDWVIKEKTQR